MSVSLSEFLLQADQHPSLAFTAVLILAVILVNGWTDAPNAIACAVVTDALSFRTGVILAAVCNFLGVVCMTALQPAVAQTIFSMAVFSGSPREMLCALCAAMAAILLWATAAWLFGIPTSESHALAAGVTGAAAALEGSLDCVCRDSWGKILLGLVLSVGLGIFLGKWVRRLLAPLPISPQLGRKLQIPGAALTAFLHGAQDGQKFLGIFLLACALSQGHHAQSSFLIPVWAMFLCALFMALGTALGGRRIIDRVGRDMVEPDHKDALACDGASGLCLLLSTLLGLPVSTTHARTCAMLGAAAGGGKAADRRVAGSIAAAWLFTFPCCFCLGALLARSFLRLL